jgi:imidazolonepropionase-like amidohydrolase
MALTLIHNGTLIDGNGSAPLKNAAILIQDNAIREAGPYNSIRLPDAPIAMLDAGGGFILPGFIDTHVHIMFEDFDVLREMRDPLSLNFYRAVRLMRQTLDAGVTTVRDAGGADLGVKQAVEQELIAGPRLQISISIMGITGGHVDYWLPSPVIYDELVPYPGRPHGVCDGVEGVRKKVREILRAGAEVVKVCTTGGVMSPTDAPDFTQFSLEELRVIVQEAAYRRGTKVMSHAQGVDGVKNAVLAGIHSIEHGVYLDDEAIELMLKHGTYLVPTLVAIVGILEAAEQKGNMPEWGVRKAKEILEIHRDSIAKAYRAGVTISMGTDVPAVPHGENLRELELMCHIGMSPMEAIVATTRTAAKCLGWQDQIGTLEAGKLADVVISKTDPLADIRALAKPENIVLVMKDGKIHKDKRGL